MRKNPKAITISYYRSSHLLQIVVKNVFAVFTFTAYLYSQLKC
jgi:hypothetical protein